MELPRRLDGGGSAAPLYLPTHHLVTHGVVVTGSGKTGLVTVLTEEALRAGVPVLVVDVKGDLPYKWTCLPGGGDSPRLREERIPIVDQVSRFPKETLFRIEKVLRAGFLTLNARASRSAGANLPSLAGSSLPLTQRSTPLRPGFHSSIVLVAPDGENHPLSVYGLLD